MLVEEKCVYRPNPENPACTQVQREAWVTSSVFGFSRAIQEFGLARFRRNQIKATEGFEYILANLQGEVPPKTLKGATEKAKETALAATEKAKDLASKAAPQKAKQFVWKHQRIPDRKKASSVLLGEVYFQHGSWFQEYSTKISRNDLLLIALNVYSVTFCFVFWCWLLSESLIVSMDSMNTYKWFLFLKKANSQESVTFFHLAPGHCELDVCKNQYFQNFRKKFFLNQMNEAIKESSVHSITALSKRHSGGGTR